MKRFLIFALAISSYLISLGVANAALWDRGGGLIYDDVLDITWLQDTNYAFTTEYEHQLSGHMSWSYAVEWVDGLEYYDSVRNVTWTDWRLPTTVDGPYSSWGYDGNTIGGYNITTSEMGYMYYENLGNLGRRDVYGNYLDEYGLTNTGPFTGLESEVYWSTEHYEDWTTNYVWVMGFFSGRQDRRSKNDGYRVWAVRPGDVSAVPIPGAVWLLGSGLIGIVGVRKKFKT